MILTRCLAAAMGFLAATGCASSPPAETPATLRILPDILPEILPERGSIQGPMSRQAVTRAVQSRVDALRACYTAHGGERAGLHGAQYVIGPQGRVSRVFVHCSDLAPPKLVTCLEREILALRFPRPRGRGVVVVTYPRRPPPCPVTDNE